MASWFRCRRNRKRNSRDAGCLLGALGRLGCWGYRIVRKNTAILLLSLRQGDPGLGELAASVSVLVTGGFMAIFKSKEKKAGDMVQWLKRLPCKHEDPHSDPQRPYTKACMSSMYV